MRAVMLEVPQRLLDERRAKGLDRRDEMWEGELHMVPAPSGDHQRLGAELLAVLLPVAKVRGLVAMYEGGLFRPGVDDDYRVPDQVYARPGSHTERGVDGRAELVVELRSPGDESYDKLGFYASLEVQEVLIIHPGTRAVELFALEAGAMCAQSADAVGDVVVRSLGVRFSVVGGGDGPRLRLAWDGGQTEI